MTKRVFYHVAGEKYQEGDPLLCADKLLELGFDIEWKWDEQEWAFDSDVVCVFDDLEEAKLFQADFGGTILRITIDEDWIEDNGWVGGGWKTKYGYISPKMTTVEEGFTAFANGIPAEWIEVVE